MQSPSLGAPPLTLQPAPGAPPDAGPTRFHGLDGLRGWAALSVVLFHLFWEIFTLVGPGFRNPVSSVFLDGQLAVWLFFVLSGDALSTAYFAGKGDGAVIKLAVRRYSRLTLPIVATCVVLLVLMRAGLVFNIPAAHIVHRMDWLGTFLTDPPSISAYAAYAFFGVYGPVHPPGMGVPFLWTMHYEMVGSFLVFGVLLVHRYLRWPRMTVLVLALACLITIPSGPYACFLFGILFGHLRKDGFFAAAHGRRLYQALSWVAIAVMVVALSHFHLTGGLRDRLPLAPPLVFAVFCNRRLCDFFASGPSRLLGKLSFPLYLMQFPVFVSFTSWAILFAASHGGMTWTMAWIISLASIALCFAAAWLFLPVERATSRVGAWISGHLIAPQPSRVTSGSAAA